MTIAEPLPRQSWQRCDLKLTTTQKKIYHLKKVLLANTEKKRRRGLSGKLTRGLPLMLFVWNKIKNRAFWMHNVHQPLMIAMINQKGYVVQIEKMAPNTTHNHWSKYPITHALESTPSFFKQIGLHPHSKVKITRCYR